MNKINILKDMIDFLQNNYLSNISNEWSISFLNLFSVYMKENNEQVVEAINLSNTKFIFLIKQSIF